MKTDKRPLSIIERAAALAKHGSTANHGTSTKHGISAKHGSANRAYHLPKPGATARETDEEKKIDDEELYIRLRSGKKIPFPDRAASGKEHDEKKGDGQDFRDVLAHFQMLRAYPNKTTDWQAFVTAKDHAMNVKPVPPGMIKNLGAAGGGAAAGGAVGGVRALTIGGGIVPGQVLAANPMWKFTGPSGIASDNTAPWAGRVNALAFDPKISGTYYAGAATGGLWKTTNSGASWKPITETQPAQAISSVVVDPGSSNIVYAGTGDYDGYFANGELKVGVVDTGIVPGFGILRSTDGGTTWSNVDPTHSIFGTYAIKKILPDSTTIDTLTKQTKTLYAVGGNYGNGGKVFKSTDFGLTWTSVLNSARPMRNIVFNSNNSVLYAVGDGGARAILYKSIDKGTSWQQVNVFTLPATSNNSTADVAASTLDPNVLYVSDASSESILKSTNAGASWTVLGTPALNGDWGQSWYDHFMVCTSRTLSPKNQPATKNDVLYVGLISIFQSPDAGVTWANIGQAYGQPRETHPDQHTVAINPTNTSDVLVGNDGGVWRLTYSPNVPGKNTSFKSANNGLGITQIHWGAAGPTDNTLLISGAQDNGSFQANGAFNTWQEVLGGDGFGCAINPIDPLNVSAALRGYQNQYASSQNSNVAVTENNWNTAEAISPPAGNEAVFFTPIWMHTIEPLFVYTGTQYDPVANAGGYLYEYVHPALGTANTNTSWNKYGPAANVGFGPVAGFNTLVTAFANSSLKVRIAFPKLPNQPEYLLFVGLANGGFGVSSDHGANWAEVGRSAGLPGRPITKIIASPTNPYRVWVTLAGAPGVPRFWTVDFRASVWTALPAVGLPDLPTYAALQVPGYGEQKFYVGNDSGVYFTTDGGNTFFDATQPLGLPNTVVFDLAYTPTKGILTAFTYGRGSWQLDIGNNVPANIITYLEGYKGDRTKLKIQVELYMPGTNQLIEVKTGNLTASGTFPVNFSFNGPCDMRIRVTGFLSVKLNSIVSSTGQFSTSTMYAGDTDGSNSITQLDVAAVQALLGQYSTTSADINGDGRVTVDDLKLVQGNLGRVGQ